MKKLLIACLLLLVGCSAHLGLMGVGTAAHLVNYNQTLYIADNDEKLYEVNNIMGRHPDRDTVHKYFIISGITVWAIYYLLPEKWKPYWASGYASGMLINTWRDWGLDEIPIP